MGVKYAQLHPIRGLIEIEHVGIQRLPERLNVVHNVTATELVKKRAPFGFTVFPYSRTSLKFSSRVASACAVPPGRGPGRNPTFQKATSNRPKTKPMPSPAQRLPMRTRVPPDHVSLPTQFVHEDLARTALDVQDVNQRQNVSASNTENQPVKLTFLGSLESISRWHGACSKAGHDPLTLLCNRRLVFAPHPGL